MLSHSIRTSAWIAALAALATLGCAPLTLNPPDETGVGAATDPGATTPGAADSAPGMQFVAEAIGGGQVSSDDYRGKVVLVDIFGTWCPPCRRSIPALIGLYKQYRNQGFEVIGLAYERTGDPEQAKSLVAAFAEEFQIPYTLAIGPAEAQDQVPGGFEGFPTILLLDRRGVIRHHTVGYGSGEEKVLAGHIETMLAEPSAETED